MLEILHNSICYYARMHEPIRRSLYMFYDERHKDLCCKIETNLSSVSHEIKILSFFQEN